MQFRAVLITPYGLLGRLGSACVSLASASGTHTYMYMNKVKDEFLFHMLCCLILYLLYAHGNWYLFSPCRDHSSLKFSGDSLRPGDLGQCFNKQSGQLSPIGRAPDSYVRGPGFDTRSGNILLFLLPLFQAGQLSVTGESMCTKYWLTA